MLADRGYFSGEEILACEAMGVTPYRTEDPRPQARRRMGRFGKQDFVYQPDQERLSLPGWCAAAASHDDRRERH